MFQGDTMPVTPQHPYEAAMRDKLELISLPYDPTEAPCDMLDRIISWHVRVVMDHMHVEKVQAAVVKSNAA